MITGKLVINLWDNGNERYPSLDVFKNIYIYIWDACGGTYILYMYISTPLMCFHIYYFWCISNSPSRTYLCKTEWFSSLSLYIRSIYTGLTQPLIEVVLYVHMRRETWYFICRLMCCLLYAMFTILIVICTHIYTLLLSLTSQHTDINTMPEPEIVLAIYDVVHNTYIYIYL